MSLFKQVRRNIVFKSPKILRSEIIYRTKPKHLIFEVTNVCNLKCPLCPTTTQTRTKGFLKFDDYKKIIDEIKDDITSISFYMLGEPTLNKELFKMVKYASNFGIKTGFSTNNEYIKEYIDDIFDSGLTSIQVVLDGLNKEDHEKYRVGGDFENSISSIKLLTDKKRLLNSEKPHVNLQSLLFKYNVGKESDFKKIAKELGVDSFSLKKVTMGREDEKEDLYSNTFLPEEKYLQRTEGKLYREAIICPEIIRKATILWNGDLVPCCFDSDGKDVLGNVIEDGFWNVYFGKNRKNSIKDIIYHRNPICKNCDGAS